MVKKPRKKLSPLQQAVSELFQAPFFNKFDDSSSFTAREAICGMASDILEFHPEFSHMMGDLLPPETQEEKLLRPFEEMIDLMDEGAYRFRDVFTFIDRHRDALDELCTLVTEEHYAAFNKASSYDSAPEEVEAAIATHNKTMHRLEEEVEGFSASQKEVPDYLPLRVALDLRDGYKALDLALEKDVVPPQATLEAMGEALHKHLELCDVLITNSLLVYGIEFAPDSPVQKLLREHKDGRGEPDAAEELLQLLSRSELGVTAFNARELLETVKELNEEKASLETLIKNLDTVKECIHQRGTRAPGTP